MALYNQAFNHKAEARRAFSYGVVQNRGHGYVKGRKKYRQKVGETAQRGMQRLCVHVLGVRHRQHGYARRTSNLLKPYGGSAAARAV